MYSETDVARITGPAGFARAVAYQREGRVTDVRWSTDRTTLTGRVRGADHARYSARVRLRPTPDGPVPISGRCDCPVGSDCKHVGAVLLEGRHGTPTAADRPSVADALWRRTLDPILDGLDPDESAAVLGLVFELQQVEQPWSGSRRTAPKERPLHIGVRPVLLGTNGRWRRTGVSWRTLVADWSVHEYDDAQVRLLREVYRLLTAGNAYATPDTWLHLDTCRSTALWSVLREAAESGVGLVTGGRTQAPLVIEQDAVVPAADLVRTGTGLSLRPLLVHGEPGEGRAIEPPFALVGEPGIGVATWEPDDVAADSVLVLAPFAEPLATAAHAFLRLPSAIDVPAEEEPDFLAHHYRRLASVLPVVSRDRSFAPPAQPVAGLELVLEHADGGVTGRWTWRYAMPDGRPVALGGERDAVRDPAQERRVLAAVRSAGVDAASTPALLGAHGELAPEFAVHGMAAVALARDVLPALRRLPALTVVEHGEPVEYRAAQEAPVVEVGTRAVEGSRDWFDLDIEVRVGGEVAPLADVFLALARGDDAMVLAGGVYFPLDDPVFERLRALIAEARELTDDPRAPLRISRFQGSLWDDLVALGVVARQADQWRRAVEALGGFAADGRLERRALPEGFTASLRPYQQDGYDWLSFLYDNRLGGVLADDMGLGKTVQALALIGRAVEEADEADRPRPRFLVVAPTSVVPNWVAEAQRFLPGLRVAGITETTRKSGRPLPDVVGDAELVITSYALLRLDTPSYARVEWAGLLLDEAQFAKNRHSTTYQRIRSLDVPFRLAITGTPLENDLMEFWSILSIAAPGLFPSPNGFQDHYAKPIEKEGDSARLQQLQRRVRPLLLRRTKAVVAADLPEKTEQVIEVELGRKQRAVYDRHLARERQRVLGLIEEFDRNRFSIFRALTVLRQVALDAALVDEANEGIPSAKLDLFDELLENALEEGHRVLVFSQFTRLLGRVRTRLDAADVPYSYLDGSTRRRGEAIDRFRSGDADVFLISLKAGGFGLNLAEADYCILLDPWWNPAAEAQAVDRAHRIGQQRPVMVYRLVARGTIEEKVMALQQSKRELFDSVLGGEEAAAASSLTAADVRELLA